VANRADDAAVKGTTPGDGRLMDVWNVRIILSVGKDPFQADAKVDQDLGDLGRRQALKWQCVVEVAF